MKLTRKKFLKYFYKILLIPTIWVAFLSFEKQRKIIDKKRRSLFSDIDNGINFFDDIIVIKKNNNIKVFSSKCTHLGCKIKDIESGMFVCKCHGSKFNLDGKVVEGPARRNLIELKIYYDKSRQQILVNE